MEQTSSNLVRQIHNRNRKVEVAAVVGNEASASWGIISMLCKKIWVL